MKTTVSIFCSQTCIQIQERSDAQFLDMIHTFKTDENGNDDIALARKDFSGANAIMELTEHMHDPYSSICKLVDKNDGSTVGVPVYASSPVTTLIGYARPMPAGIHKFERSTN